MEGSGGGVGAGTSLPHLPFPILYSLPQLARAGAVGSQGAQLLLEVSERVRSLTQAYFSPDRPLHLSFTHLVCRSAIEGNRQAPPQSQGPLGPCTPSAPPLCGFPSSLPCPAGAQL